jgi:hypothetical protein
MKPAEIAQSYKATVYRRMKANGAAKDTEAQLAIRHIALKNTVRNSCLTEKSLATSHEPRKCGGI